MINISSSHLAILVIGIGVGNIMGMTWVFLRTRPVTAADTTLKTVPVTPGIPEQYADEWEDEPGENDTYDWLYDTKQQIREGRVSDDISALEDTVTQNGWRLTGDNTTPRIEGKVVTAPVPEPVESAQDDLMQPQVTDPVELMLHKIEMSVYGNVRSRNHVLERA